MFSAHSFFVPLLVEEIVSQISLAMRSQKTLDRPFLDFIAAMTLYLININHIF